MWLFFGVLIVVPELWAAFWKESAPFPTISGTVAALEYSYPILGLVVVLLIVLCVYSTVRYPVSRTGLVAARDKEGRIFGTALIRDPDVPNRTALGRRITRSSTPVREIGAAVYFVSALVLIGACTTIAALRTDVDDEYPVGQTLYGLTALFWVAIPSLLAWPRRFAVDVPFLNLFATIRSMEQRLRILALLVAAGLSMLLLHLVLYPWPSNIPDLSRLHKTYTCHPLPPKTVGDLSSKERRECARIDKADVKPAPDAP